MKHLLTILFTFCLVIATRAQYTLSTPKEIEV